MYISSAMLPCFAFGTIMGNSLENVVTRYYKLVPDETISWNPGPFHVLLRGGPNSEGQMFFPFQMAYVPRKNSRNRCFISEKIKAQRHFHHLSLSQVASLLISPKRKDFR